MSIPKINSAPKNPEAPVEPQSSAPTPETAVEPQSSAPVVPITPARVGPDYVPSNWDISKTETGIYAVNIRTQRTFTGTSAEFKNSLRAGFN